MWDMPLSLSHMLLTPEEMARADEMAAGSGLSSFELMRRAGHAVAATALRRFPDALRFVVLCGPGNNGGDGYVAGAALAGSGAHVEIFALADVARLRGDARAAHSGWDGRVFPIELYRPQAGDVVIDAIFGAGLSRDIDRPVAEVIAKVEDAGLPVLAVDLPSGLCGRRGVPMGAAFAATCTVTFMTRKPGHLLLPGRSLCGDVEVVDIGIPHRIIASVAGNLRENAPPLWQSMLPHAGSDSHKYKKGHLAVFAGGASKTGAARLSALAGLKTGAGLVTIASPEAAITENAAHLTAIMLAAIDDAGALEAWLERAKVASFVLGPGFGIGQKAREFTLFLRDRPLVLDADGMTSFRDDPSLLFDAFAGGDPHLVLTPHEGEFARLFPDLAADTERSKVEKALEAAERAHAAIVYKGADTVVASPDGRAVINTNGSPWLATAGSGDVLAGMIGALLAQGMPAFEAAAAGVHLHGEAAKIAGAGMTAEDLAGQAGRAMAHMTGQS